MFFCIYPKLSFYDVRNAIGKMTVFDHFGDMLK